MIPPFSLHLQRIQIINYHNAKYTYMSNIKESILMSRNYLIIYSIKIIIFAFVNSIKEVE